MTTQQETCDHLLGYDNVPYEGVTLIYQSMLKSLSLEEFEEFFYCCPFCGHVFNWEYKDDNSTRM